MPNSKYAPISELHLVTRDYGNFITHEEQWRPTLTGFSIVQLQYGLPCTVFNFIALFSLTAAAPLTPETVTAAVKEVTWDDLCWYLHVPPSKHDEILAHSPSEDHRRVLVDWWFITNPAPSWRELIHRLDFFCGLGTAANIRHNAEPVEGMLSKCMPCAVTCSLIHTAV